MPIGYQRKVSFLVSGPHTWVSSELLVNFSHVNFWALSAASESQRWVEFYMFLFLKHFPGVPDDAR